MEKINKNKIYFFETEDSERDLVLQKFPDAKPIEEPFNAETADKYTDAEVLSGMIKSDFSAETLSKCPNLKLIVTRTVGYDDVGPLPTMCHPLPSSVDLVPTCGLVTTCIACTWMIQHDLRK